MWGLALAAVLVAVVFTVLVNVGAFGAVLTVIGWGWNAFAVFVVVFVLLLVISGFVFGWKD